MLFQHAYLCFAILNSVSENFQITKLKVAENPRENCVKTLDLGEKLTQVRIYLHVNKYSNPRAQAGSFRSG